MIVVTGASGFVGGALTRRLLASSPSQVTAAVRRAGSSPPGLREVVVGELDAATDWREALRGKNTVYHCAARVHVMRDTSADPLASFRAANVAGTLRLAQQAADAGVRRFVFMSSIKVNGESTDGRAPFRADDPPAPAGPYGVSKLEAEEGLRRIAVATGMEVAVVRAPLVYGRGVKGNFASISAWVARGYPLPLGGATRNRRSMVGIDNLVDLLVTAAQHPGGANETFLVSDGEDVSTAGLIAEIARAHGRRRPFVPFPLSLLRTLLRAAGKSEVEQRLLGDLRVDIAPTYQALGWTPPVSFREGIRRAAATENS